METALHQLVVWVETVLDQQQTALGVFLDIEGVFNGTSYGSMWDALVRHWANHTIVRWIKATLRTVETRCIVRLLVNPDKTELIVFTRRRKPPGFFKLHFFRVTLSCSMSVKYLGVIQCGAWDLRWSIGSTFLSFSCPWWPGWQMAGAKKTLSRIQRLAC